MVRPQSGDATAGFSSIEDVGDDSLVTGDYADKAEERWREQVQAAAEQKGEAGQPAERAKEGSSSYGSIEEIGDNRLVSGSYGEDLEKRWQKAPYAFSPLNPLLTPRMAVGLAVDWADLPELLLDMVIKNRVPHEERQAAASEIIAKLEGWVADGSISHPMLGLKNVPHVYILPYIFEWLNCDALEGLPLLHDAAVFCGCGVVCDWAFRGDRTMPQIASLLGGFLSFIAERIEDLGRAACEPEPSLASQGLETAETPATGAALATTTATAAESGVEGRRTTPRSASGAANSSTVSRQRSGTAEGGASAGASALPAGSAGASAIKPAIPGDSSTMPGVRAAALAYALHVVALALARCDFPDWVSVWRRQLDASSRLLDMLGAPPGAQLPSWQVVALKLMRGPVLLPLTSHDPRIPIPGRACTSLSPVEVFKRVVGPAAMEGCVTMLARLTGPYEALHQQHRIPTLSTYNLMAEHLNYCTSGVCKCLLNRHLAREFVLAGGIDAMLDFLSRYATLQRGLTWRHQAHDIAAECFEALNMLPYQSPPQPESRTMHPERQAMMELLIKAGVSPVFLAVLRDFPSMGYVANYVSQCNLADPTRESPHVRMLLSMLAVLRLVCQASAAAKRELALELGGLTLLVQKGTHWEPGVPLGTPEGKMLAEQTPGVGRMFRLWAQFPLALVAEMLQAPSAAEKDSLGGKRGLGFQQRWGRCGWGALAAGVLAQGSGEAFSNEAFDRLRQLMAPAELLGLLRWRDSEANDGISVPVEIPGISKVLAGEQYFLEYLLELCCAPFQTPDDPLDDLQRRAWATTLLHDMLWHLSTAAQGRSAASSDRSRQLITSLLEGGALHAALRVLQGALAGAWDLEKYMDERLQLLRGSARRELRRDQAQFSEKGLYWYWQPAAAASMLLETLLAQEPSLVKRACRDFVSARDPPVLGPPFPRLCAAMQRSRDKNLRAVAASAAAAIRRVEALAKEAQQEEANAEAAARETAAAALLEEEEAAQQAQHAKAARRQRQKAAKQAQQARERADREERERRQKAEQEQQREAEEQQRRKAEEQKRKEAEDRQRRQIEERQEEQAARPQEQAKQQGALKPPTSSKAREPEATKASKRQLKKKATQQAQHAHAKQATAKGDVHPGTSPADPGDACAEPALPSQQLPAASLSKALAASPLTEEQPALVPNPAEALSSLEEAQQPALSPGGNHHEPTAAVAEKQQPARSSGANHSEPAAAQAEEQDPELQELLSMLFPAMQPPTSADAKLANVPARPPQQEACMPGEATNRIRSTATSASSSGVDCTVWVSLDDSAATEASPTKLLAAQSAHPPSLAAVVQCRLSGKPIQDPVVAADGWTYERSALEAYLAAGSNTSPVTGQPLGSTLPRPNFAVRDLLVAGLGA
ncbi:hypothetical protein N2152v2_006705 [Parachlorella kessleri]